MRRKKLLLVTVLLHSLYGTIVSHKVVSCDVDHDVLIFIRWWAWLVMCLLMLPIGWLQYTDFHDLSCDWWILLLPVLLSWSAKCNNNSKEWKLINHSQPLCCLRWHVPNRLHHMIKTSINRAPAPPNKSHYLYYSQPHLWASTMRLFWKWESR